MRRSSLALVALLVVSAGATGVALAHDVNHLAADAQVSADGSLVLESAYAMSDGFVVLYRGWDGRSGEMVGVTPFSAARVDVTEVPVSFAHSAWAAVEENATVTAVLYADDGEENGTFDPGDSPQTSFGRATQATFDVARGEAPVYVSAAGLGAQQSSGSVFVREVALAELGYLALSLSEGGEPTRTLGSVALSPGVHEDVTVPLNRTFLAEREGTFTVFVTAYVDDGDGTFGPEDRPVRASGSLVTTRFSVSPRVENATGTPTSVVNTPSPSATPATPTGSATPTTTTTTTTRDGPGFGPTVALLAAALLVVGTRCRR